MISYLNISQETQIIMIFAPAYDMSIGILFVVFGSLWPLLLFIPAFLIEGIILKWLEATASPFTASFVMNLITTLLGIPMGFAFGNLVYALTESTNYSSDSTYMFLSTSLVLFLSWFFSVLVEAIILVWIYHLSIQLSWRVSVKANSASYLAGLILFGIFYSLA